MGFYLDIAVNASSIANHYLIWGRVVGFSLDRRENGEGGGGVEVASSSKSTFGQCVYDKIWLL